MSMSIERESDVVDVQRRAFGAKWTRAENLLSNLRYPEAAAGWLLKWTLKQSGELERSTGDVMEFGFGHGRILLDFPRACRVFGIELSGTAVEEVSRRAKSRGYVGVDLRWAESGELHTPWPNDSFDAVLCSHVIEHVADDAMLVRELARVLKPKARAYLLVPLDAPESRGLLDPSQRMNPAFPVQSYHVRAYNLCSFCELLTSNGFTIVSASRMDALLAARENWPRPLQILSSVVFALTPKVLWRSVDKHYLARGIEGRQAMVIATKA